MEQADQARILARNRRQTMDWALVLASQGVNAIIDDGADGQGWGLIVDTADYPAAIRAIRLYRQENRHWRWREPISWQGFLFDWKVCLWAMLLVGFYYLSHVSRPEFAPACRMDNAAVLAGEWWRIFTAMLLHADIAHLATNVSIGTLLLGLAMGRYGAGAGLLGAYLAGAGGNLAGLILYPASHLGVGASGMVLGALGMLAAQSLNGIRRNAAGRKRVIKGALAGVMLFVLFGLSSDQNVDLVAHLGGFMTGALFGCILMWLPAGWHHRKTDLAAGLAFITLLASTCWLAIR